MDLHQIQKQEDKHRAALQRLAVARWEEIRRLHIDEGLSYVDIGKIYRGISKQRIMQIFRMIPSMDARRQFNRKGGEE